MADGEDLAGRADRLAQAWKQWDQVDLVQLDSAWVQRLEAILRFARIGLGFLAACVAVVVLATGIVGSSFYEVQRDVILAPGESARIGFLRSRSGPGCSRALGQAPHHQDPRGIDGRPNCRGRSLSIGERPGLPRGPRQNQAQRVDVRRAGSGLRLLDPLAVVVHEISEAAGVLVEGVREDRALAVEEQMTGFGEPGRRASRDERAALSSRKILDDDL